MRGCALTAATLQGAGYGAPARSARAEGLGALLRVERSARAPNLKVRAWLVELQASLLQEENSLIEMALTLALRPQ